jgi:hypothetical protein
MTMASSTRNTTLAPPGSFLSDEKAQPRPAPSGCSSIIAGSSFAK